jgi:hypothetical protein
VTSEERARQVEDEEFDRGRRIRAAIIGGHILAGDVHCDGCAHQQQPLTIDRLGTSAWRPTLVDDEEPEIA